MKKTLIAIFAISLMAGFAFVACGEEDTQEPVEDIIDVVEKDVPVATFPDLTGKSFMVTVLDAVQPTDQVNEVWAEDIAAHQLVILFYIVSHDMATGKFEFQVTSCDVETVGEGEDKKPTKYTYALDPSIVTGTLTGTNFQFDTEIELDIITPNVNKSFHLFGVMGSGRFNNEGTKIIECYLAGAILEEEVFDLCLTIPGLGPANFHWFMNTAHICAQFDSDEDGTNDSYKFEGNLQAEETDLFNHGEIKEIVSLVEECPYDDKKCTP